MRVITILLILLVSCSYAQESSPCKKAGKAENAEATCWGWAIGPPVDGGIVREIRGQVGDIQGNPLFSNVLVEVFDYPEIALSDDSAEVRSKQLRVAVYQTDASGKFCIKGLKPGRYEIRASCIDGFDAGRVVVTLKPKSRRRARNNPIPVRMNVSG